MTEDHFTIRHDAAREFLHLTMFGNWDREMVERFRTAVAVALREMILAGARHGHIMTLCDMREKNILPQDAAAEFAGLVRPGSPSKRIALLLSGVLHRLQTRRIQRDPRARMFDDEAQAYAWLAEEDASQTPRAV